MKIRAPAFSFDRWGVAVGALFLGVAGAVAWNADPSLGFGPDQAGYNVFAEELLVTWEEGLSPHSEFGSLYRQSFAVMLAVGQHFLVAPVTSFKLILFMAALAYLWAMYIMLANVLDNRAVAVVTSVLSIVQRYTIGTSFWGMGEFQSILPRVVVLGVFPLAWLLFERHLRSPRVLDAFVVAGLGLALHLSAAFFYCILLSTYGLFVVWRRAWPAVTNLMIATALFFFSLVAVPNSVWSPAMDEAGLQAAIVTLAGLGLVLYYARSAQSPLRGVVGFLYLGVCFGLLLAPYPFMVFTGAGSSTATSLEATNAAIYARFGWTLFPISGATLGFALYNVGILGAVALYEFVRRWRRGPTEREHIVGLYVVSVFTVSLGLTAAMQLYCRISGRPDMVLELFRAFRFIFLPLYIYLGLFLQRAWSERRGVGGRLLLGVLVVVLLLPPRQMLAAMPDHLKLWVRDAVESSRSLHQGDPSQRQYLEILLATDAEREAARIRHRDFVELCEWVKRSTPEDAVFMTTDYNFIHHAGRDIMMSYAQGAPGGARSKAKVSGYVAWHEALLAISSAYASRSPTRIMAVARRYEVDYIVADADQPPLPVALVHENDTYFLYRVTP